MAAIVENFMVMDRWWEAFDKYARVDAEKIFTGPGYTENSTGIFVSEDKALEYAMKMLSWDTDLQLDFVEWFYSKGWTKEE